jgi:hypothetical protein
MRSTEAPTTAELKAAWQRAGLWRLGMTYSAAVANPLTLWAMKNSALAVRRRHHLPVQPALF